VEYRREIPSIHARGGLSYFIVEVSISHVTTWLSCLPGEREDGREDGREGRREEERVTDRESIIR